MASDKCTQHGLRDNDGYAVATPRAALHHCTYAQHATYEMPPGYPRGSQSLGMNAYSLCWQLLLRVVRNLPNLQASSPSVTWNIANKPQERNPNPKL